MFLSFLLYNFWCSANICIILDIIFFELIQHLFKIVFCWKSFDKRVKYLGIFKKINVFMKNLTFTNRFLSVHKINSVHLLCPRKLFLNH